jgi:ankyrin repeat protein
MSPPPSTTSWSLPRSNNNSGSVNKGKTALHITAERGNLRIAQFLLANEVDVDVADAEGRTALHYAARGAHADIVALLLAEGADPEARDAEGRSPLHAAADAECELVIRLLAKEGADLNAAIGVVVPGESGGGGGGGEGMGDELGAVDS